MESITYDFRPESFARWIKLGDRHLSAANMLAESAPGHAAERYLKACLVRRAQAFANSVTDLRSLLKTCATLEPRYERITGLEMLDRLNEWETAFAYPSQSAESDPVVPGVAELMAARCACESLRELALKE